MTGRGEQGNDSASMTFWDHLDVLRGVLLRIMAVAVAFAVVAFIFKDEVFGIVLAPKLDNFVTYRLIDRLLALCGLPGREGFNVELINTGLAQQFMIHLKTAMCVGVLCASPYILAQLYLFVAPGLYTKERKYATSLIVWGYVMFLVGVLLSYFVIFPVTFQFLGTYQVSGDVTNLISLESYMSVLLTLSLCLGLLCEMPVVAWILGRAGVIDAGMLCKYRRHAIVVILIVAAVITPTADVFTLLLFAVPIWVLYEASILLVRRAGGKSITGEVRDE